MKLSLVSLISLDPSYRLNHLLAIQMTLLSQQKPFNDLLIVYVERIATANETQHDQQSTSIDPSFSVLLSAVK